MNRGICFYLIAATAALLCAPAIAARPYVGPRPGETVRETNPALVGVKKVYVIVEPADPRVQSLHGLKWKDIQDNVEQTLKDAGFEIAPGVVLGKGERDREIPEYRVYLDLTSLPNLNIHVFRCQTALAVKAQIPEKNLSFKAEIWQAKPAMHAIAWDSMPMHVINLFLVQTKSFISDWEYANGMAQIEKETKTIDYTESGATNPSKASGKSGRNTPAAEHKYIASKNGRVFHRPDCDAVKKIKPANLVYYEDRAEAIKAGKRPCKLCKP